MGSENNEAGGGPFLGGRVAFIFWNGLPQRIQFYHPFQKLSKQNCPVRFLTAGVALR